MSVYWNKARARWMHNFRHAGLRHAGYCLDEEGKPVTSRRAAEAAERRVRAAVEQQPRDTPQAPDPAVYTVAQAMADYAAEHGESRATWDNNVRPAIREFLDFFGADAPAASITPDRIEAYIRWSRQQPTMTYVGGPRGGGKLVVRKDAPLRSEASTNRRLSTLRAALRWAAERGRMPGVKVRSLEEPEPLPNPITPLDARAILMHAPPHLQVVIALGTLAGLRKAEIVSLDWRRVDLVRRVIWFEEQDVKGRRAQSVVINDALHSVLSAVQDQQRREAGLQPGQTLRGPVVRYRGRPIKGVRRSWEKALRDAGLAGAYTLHDTRAAFCTALADAGMSPLQVQKAARHRSITTTMRHYVRVADPTIAAAFRAAEILALPAKAGDEPSGDGG